MTDFSKLKKAPAIGAFTHTNIIVDKAAMQASEAHIAELSKRMDEVIAGQQLAMERRMLEYMMKPMVFVHPVKDDTDGVEIRMRSWCMPVAMPRGTFYIDDPDPPRVDPLDIEYDGVTLRDLLALRQCVDRENGGDGPIPLSWRNADPWTWTPAQRAAVSAHWSAELRAKIAASKERERNAVRIDLQDEP